MAFPIAWAVGSFIGGFLAKEFYDEVIADHYDDDEEREKAYPDEVLMTLFEKLKKANDAQGLYDFGILLEDDDEAWAKKFFKAAADMDFIIAQQKLRCMEES